MQGQLASARQEASQLALQTQDLRAHADSLEHETAAAKTEAAVQANLVTHTLAQSREATAAAHKQTDEAMAQQEAQASAAKASHDWASAEKAAVEKRLEEARTTMRELERRLECAQGRLAPLVAEKEGLIYRLSVAEAAAWRRGVCGSAVCPEACADACNSSMSIKAGGSTRMGGTHQLQQIAGPGTGSRAAATDVSTVDEVGPSGQAIHAHGNAPSATGGVANASGPGEASSRSCLEADDAKVALCPAFFKRVTSSSWPGNGASSCSASFQVSLQSIVGLSSRFRLDEFGIEWSPAGSALSCQGAQSQDRPLAEYKQSLQVRRQLACWCARGLVWHPSLPSSACSQPEWLQLSRVGASELHIGTSCQSPGWILCTHA